MYCVIIGSLIELKEQTPSERKCVLEKMENILARINYDFKENIVAEFIITSGDEFQGQLSASWISIKIIELMIKELYPHPIIFGIGLSNIYIKINSEKALSTDGTAYYFAREGLTEEKNRINENSFAVYFKTDKNDEALINALCRSVDLIMKGWTVKQREIIWKMSEMAEQQNLIAAELGLNPSTVTRHLKASQYSYYRELLTTIMNYFRKEYDFALEGTSLDCATGYYNAGIYLMSHFDFENSLDNLYKALEIRVNELGSHHQDTAVVYNEIATVYSLKGEVDSAQTYFQKALEIREKGLGEEHLETAVTYNDLGSVYLLKGEVELALGCHQKALEIREKALGKTHPDIAVSYHNLGTAYLAMDEADKALEYYQKALEIREMVLGPKHLDTASTIHNIGNVYLKKNDIDKALAYYQKALEIKEKGLGLKHPDTAATYHNIGNAYATKGDVPKALKYLQKALTIREKVLGTNHSDTATSYNSMGYTYLINGNVDKSLESYQKVLQIREKVLGKDHIQTANTYNNIGIVYSVKSENALSLEYYQKALVIREKLLGPMNIDTASTYDSIGNGYLANGEEDKAINYYQKALAIYESQESVKTKKLCQKIEHIIQKRDI